jgi:hypothetical protein
MTERSGKCPPFQRPITDGEGDAHGDAARAKVQQLPQVFTHISTHTFGLCVNSDSSISTITPFPPNTIGVLRRVVEHTSRNHW